MEKNPLTVLLSALVVDTIFPAAPVLGRPRVLVERTELSIRQMRQSQHVQYAYLNSSTKSRTIWLGLGLRLVVLVFVSYTVTLEHSVEQVVDPCSRFVWVPQAQCAYRSDSSSSSSSSSSSATPGISYL